MWLSTAVSMKRKQNYTATFKLQGWECRNRELYSRKFGVDETTLLKYINTHPSQGIIQPTVNHTVAVENNLLNTLTWSTHQFLRIVAVVFNQVNTVYTYDL